MRLGLLGERTAGFVLVVRMGVDRSVEVSPQALLDFILTGGKMRRVVRFQLTRSTGLIKVSRDDCGGAHVLCSLCDNHAQRRSVFEMNWHSSAL